jgi:5,5'-dehydrodivanillate O-demethylase
MLRKRFFEDLDRVANGNDPKGIIRDPQTNACVSLPIAHRSVFVDGLTFDELANHPVLSTQLKGYAFQAGQPDRVRKSYEEAMGISRRGIWIAER